MRSRTICRLLLTVGLAMVFLGAAVIAGRVRAADEKKKPADPDKKPKTDDAPKPKTDEPMYYTVEKVSKFVLKVMIYNTPIGDKEVTVDTTPKGNLAERTVAVAIQDKDHSIFVDVNPTRMQITKVTFDKTVVKLGKPKPAAPAPSTTKTDDKPKEPGKSDPEKDAETKLNLAKNLASSGLIAKAKMRYQEIIEKFPGTKAAAEAKELLEKLK